MRTKRLIFYKFEQKDFDYYLKMVTDIEIMRMITGKVLSKEDARIRFAEIVSLNNDNPTFGFFGIRKIVDKEYIGYSKIVLTGEITAEIGYSLLPEFWNKGYGSEISIGLVEYSRSIRSIKKLIAIIDPENNASKRILVKSKFKLEKTFEMDGLPSSIYMLDLNEN